MGKRCIPQYTSFVENINNRKNRRVTEEGYILRRRIQVGEPQLADKKRKNLKPEFASGLQLQGRSVVAFFQQAFLLDYPKSRCASPLLPLANL
jgi:hypothetical protein